MREIIKLDFKTIKATPETILQEWVAERKISPEEAQQIRLDTIPTAQALTAAYISCAAQILDRVAILAKESSFNIRNNPLVLFPEELVKSTRDRGDKINEFVTYATTCMLRAEQFRTYGNGESNFANKLYADTVKAILDYRASCVREVKAPTDHVPAADQIDARYIVPYLPEEMQERIKLSSLNKA